MNTFPPTLILRHRKENLKKCSLEGLVRRKDIRFYTYPWKEAIPSLENYIVLTLEAPPLTREEASYGIFLIDASWRYAERMFNTLKRPFTERSLPAHFVTAYPRRQQDCLDPTRGLASIEALYLAYQILGRDCSLELLKHYYWKEAFLQKNSLL